MTDAPSTKETTAPEIPTKLSIETSLGTLTCVFNDETLEVLQGFENDPSLAVGLVVGVKQLLRMSAKDAKKVFEDTLETYYEVNGLRV